VIVDAPRSLEPDAFSATADSRAGTSTPAFCQNVRSSADVVASRIILGMSS
jgi:hypothetical protein